MVYDKIELVRLLRKLASEVGETPTTSQMDDANNMPSYETYHSRFGSWNDALREAGLTLNNRFSDSTEDELSDMLTELADELGETPTARQMSSAESTPNASKYKSQFGSWNAALKAAGLGVNRQQTSSYSLDELIDMLTELADELGKTPTTSQMDNAESTPNSLTYHSRFGSWNNALEAAGLDVNQPFNDSSKDELSDMLTELADELGETPTTSQMNNAESTPGSTTYCRRFGGWNAALKAAGLSINEESPSYADDELIDVLTGLADELGETPTTSQMNNAESTPGSVTYCRRFGSWNAALKVAGLNVNRPQNGSYSMGELSDMLTELADELGKTPTTSQMDNAESTPNSVTYRSRFGSWNEALREAGLAVNRQQTSSYSLDELIDMLAELADELGETPTTTQMDNAESTPNSLTYHSRFGSWNAALKAAGLSVNRPQNGSYSMGELSDMLTELADELGKTPTTSQMDNAESTPNSVTYRSRFGSWNEALRKAGLAVNRQQTSSYSMGELSDMLAELADELGETPTTTQMDNAESTPNSLTYHSRFGSWNAALKAAGLSVNRPQNGSYSMGELSDMLTELADTLGKTPTTSQMDNAESTPNSATYKARFGSWNAALKAAGLGVNRQQTSSYSMGELSDMLTELADTLGETPTTSQMDNTESAPSASTYCSRFGSWNEALREAGLDINQDSPTG